jgi:hypothetical protein
MQAYTKPIPPLPLNRLSALARQPTPRLSHRRLFSATPPLPTPLNLPRAQLAVCSARRPLSLPKARPASSDRQHNQLDRQVRRVHCSAARAQRSSPHSQVDCSVQRRLNPLQEVCLETWDKPTLRSPAKQDRLLLPARAACSVVEGFSDRATSNNSNSSKISSPLGASLAPLPNLSNPPVASLARRLSSPSSHK